MMRKLGFFFKPPLIPLYLLSTVITIRYYLADMGVAYTYSFMPCTSEKCGTVLIWLSWELHCLVLNWKGSWHWYF